MRRYALLSFLILLVACASSTRPASIAQPEVGFRLLSPIFFGSGSTAPVTIEVEVTNRANVPLRVREVELSSPGMMEYAIQRTRRIVSETIAPGQTRTFTVPATAVASVAAVTPSEPLSLNGIIMFEVNGTRFQEIVRQHQVSLP